jgi:hypothetical protein
MTRRLIVCFTAIALACVASFTIGAGKSPVADAIEKGDIATLRTLLLAKIGPSIGTMRLLSISSSKPAPKWERRTARVLLPCTWRPLTATPQSSPLS